MSVNTPAAYGMYSQDASLNDIVHTLNQAGFVNEDICMMLSPSHPIAALVRDASLFSSERGVNNNTAGLIGWLSKFGAVMIPTVGFFIRSQAFFHALMVARDAPALCANSRSLVGLGFSHDDADRFERQLRNLGVLVYVACPESVKTLGACEALRHAGALEAAILHESNTMTAVAAA
jgi:hypothetical protein